MAKQLRRDHPFADLVGLRIDETAPGTSRASLEVHEGLYNPHRVVNGGALFSLADTAMGAALYTLLEENETCATIEMKINFTRTVATGMLDCQTSVLRRGKSTAVLESRITSGGELVAIAMSTYAIFPAPD